VGGEACCVASCGICGGTGCDKRPGGASACCGGTIAAAHQSCDTHAAPCILNPTSQRQPVGVHAALDDRGVAKVLVVSKALNQSQTRRVRTCLPSAAAPRTGALRLLSAPSVTTTWEGGISYAGQTFNTSRDGKPSGDRSAQAVQAQPSANATEECFNFELPPLAAALLVVPAP